ncbi:MAG TPA: hypothetical protein VLB84_01655 [Bacteroidia bacterium]|nr:hypothetical protein [Bacteroidia bacterium]
MDNKYVANKILEALKNSGIEMRKETWRIVSQVLAEQQGLSAANASYKEPAEEDEQTTFKDWEAFMILNYPSYSNDKNIMRMLKELYDLDRE